jgi:hypothetical protein
MTIGSSWWLNLKRAWSKWIHAAPPLVPPGYPSQADIEASTSGYTPGGWDVTANAPQTERATQDRKLEGDGEK